MTRRTQCTPYLIAWHCRGLPRGPRYLGMPGIDPAAHNSGGTLVSGDQVQVTGMIVAPSCHGSQTIRARGRDTGSPVRNCVFERLQALEPTRLHDPVALVLVIHGESPCFPHAS